MCESIHVCTGNFIKNTNLYPVGTPVYKEEHVDVDDVDVGVRDEFVNKPLTFALPSNEVTDMLTLICVVPLSNDLVLF
jgi:hypothetical protein